LARCRSALRAAPGRRTRSRAARTRAAARTNSGVELDLARAPVSAAVRIIISPPDGQPESADAAGVDVVAAPLRDGTYQQGNVRPSLVTNDTSSCATPKGAGGTTAQATCVST
jgi:hypothetical protein